MLRLHASLRERPFVEKLLNLAASSGNVKQVLKNTTQALFVL